jgi:Fe-S-cluster containining protein
MSLCALCAQKRTSCCVSRDILVTTMDVQRISLCTGIDTFFEYRKPSSSEYIDQDDDPNWNAITVQQNGTRRVLRREGDFCCFLTGHGCRLTSPVRPLVCRLHPLEYSESGLTGLSSECPVEFLLCPETLLESLGMNLDESELLRKQLYEELRQGI